MPGEGRRHETTMQRQRDSQKWRISLSYGCREKSAGTRPTCKEKEIAEMPYLFLVHAGRKVPVQGHYAKRKRSQKMVYLFLVWLRRYKTIMQRERERSQR
jgi:hypothetical protein